MAIIPLKDLQGYLQLNENKSVISIAISVKNDIGLPKKWIVSRRYETSTGLLRYLLKPMKKTSITDTSTVNSVLRQLDKPSIPSESDMEFMSTLTRTGNV